MYFYLLFKNDLMKLSLVIMFVLLSFGSFAQTSPAATEILKTAYAKAKREHKNVILMCHAAWCGCCKKMEASINDSACNKFFADNYVVAYLDVMERPGKESMENA